MARWFNSASASFETDFSSFMAEPRGSEADTTEIVAAILKDVRTNGGRAVAGYTKKFDRFDIDEATLTSDQLDLTALAAACPDKVKTAIDFAHDRIATYHKAQMPDDHQYDDGHGMELGWRWTPLDSVGVYVPGGRANYPSSVLMNMVPAKVAGVERIVMVAPTPDGDLSPAVAYAAIKAGVREFYPIGGAQAVAALAFGAGDLKPVDKIVGPGNAFVAEAKRQVFGKVGIDTIAGPSEICVIGDGSVSPDWIAADLLSQAEHDPSSQSILISLSEEYARSVVDSVEQQLETLPTAETARQSWGSHGGVVVVSDLEAACRVANQVASEHLELAITNPKSAVPLIKHAGALFLGAWAPEALGDYVTGSNHVLPTYGAARFASGLGLFDFIKRMSVQNVSEAGFRYLSEAALNLAEAEHLPAHRKSVSIRLGKETPL